MKGCKVLSLVDQNITVTRNVTFHELLFPFVEHSTWHIDDAPTTEANEGDIETSGPQIPTARKHNHPKYPRDYHCYLAEHWNAHKYEGTKSHPLSSVVSYDKLSDSQKVFSFNITT